MCVCVCVCTSIHIYIYIYRCIYIYTYIHTFYICVCKCVCIYICMCVYIKSKVSLYIYIYAYSGRSAQSKKIDSCIPFNLSTLLPPLSPNSRAGPHLPTNGQAVSRAANTVNTHRPKFQVRARPSYSQVTQHNVTYVYFIRSSRYDQALDCLSNRKNQRRE